MSFIFIPQHQKPTNSPDIRETIKKMLDENCQLLQIIHESQLMGKISDCIEYQKVLHRNIVYLAKLADSEHAPLQVLLFELQAHGNQLRSGLIDEMNQIQPSGQCEQMSNQGYAQQQGHFTILKQQMLDQQTIIPNNQSLMPRGRTGQISHSSVEHITNQHPVMAQKQSVMPGHPSGMVQGSTSGTVSSGSDYGTITHPIGQQVGYYSAQPGLEYSNQQGYLQLQGYSQQQQVNGQQQQVNGQQQQVNGQQQQVIGQQQYSHSGLDSSSKNGEYMPGQFTTLFTL